MHHVASSFSWPFRARSRGTWAMGIVAVALFPLLFIPLFGYAISAMRAALLDSSSGPPPWSWSPRLVQDGAWVALALALTAAPFVAGHALLSAILDHRFGVLVSETLAWLAVFFVGGAVLLVLAPHATARFAVTGDFHDLFDVVAAIRGVRRHFATWNVVVAAIVTAWAIGLACVGLLCVGILPGVFYAILVSAHAAAALQGQSSNSSSR